MTQPFDDEYGDRLRRALHAEADAVTPSPEGLERIRRKVNQRRERRLGFISYSAPWLRPLAAVTAALTVCFAAVSITPALANFVQTGHFSPESSGDGGGTTQSTGRSYGQVPPGQLSTPVPGGSPSPSSPRPSNTAKHGKCPRVRVTAGPSVSPRPSPNPTTKVVCQSPSAKPGGGEPTSPPVTQPPPPVTPSAPQGPTTPPASESPAVSTVAQSP